MYHFSIFNDKRKVTSVKNSNVDLEEKLNISYRLNYEVNDNYICFNGFAFSSDIGHNNSNVVKVIFKGNGISYILSSKKVFDDYVSLYHFDNYNFSNFYIKAKKEKINKGIYECWLVKTRWIKKLFKKE